MKSMPAAGQRVLSGWLESARLSLSLSIASLDRVALQSDRGDGDLLEFLDYSEL